MREKIFFTGSDKRDYVMSVSDLPDICPTCHRKVKPEQLLGVLEGSEYEGVIEAVFRCPSGDCRSLFFGRFTRTRSPANYPDCFMYQGVWPWAPEKVAWPKEIEDLSPRFVEVYNSANAASRHGLDDLVGMGYRKALEFLVKDFAIASNQGREESIRKAQLGQVIDAYCDAKVKDTAKRAAWLGNDETHYERIWGAQDVKDLKILIKLTVNWIESEILTGHYKRMMPEKK